MNELDEIFDDKKLKKAVRKARIRNIVIFIFISIIIFVIGSYISFKISMNLSNKEYEHRASEITLSIPNGYISKSVDYFGFFGGKGERVISKNVGGKAVTLNEESVTFGLGSKVPYGRFNGGNNHGYQPIITDGVVDANGYRQMKFYHPEIQYEKYINNLGEIDKIPDGKIIEMAISFDKPYNAKDIFMMQQNLKPATITWIWLDEFSGAKSEEIKKRADFAGMAIDQEDTIGMSVNNTFNYNVTWFKEDFNVVLDNLSKSRYQDHKEIYEKLKDIDVEKEKVNALGVVVQGTKEQLKELVGNPMIKASVFGIIVDPIY